MSIGQINLIALGANLPSGEYKPQAVLSQALVALANAGVPVLARSRFYRTPCFPAGAGPDYVNAAALLGGDMPADALLRLLHRIEADFGRERVVRWGMRTLDLDLIAIGGQVLPDVPTVQRWIDLPPQDQPRATPERLILPHPRMQDRAFVLVPLCDIAPDWVHPILGRSAAQMCADLPEQARAEVVPLDPLDT